MKSYHGLRISFFSLALVQASLLVWGSDASVFVQLLAIFISASIGALLFLWVGLDQSFNSISNCTIIGLALILRLVAAYASPLLEDDHYRYLWDGFQTATTFNPYLQAPLVFFNEPTISAFWQDILYSINYPEVPTIYGPVLQGLFALGYKIEPGRIGALQSILLLSDMGILLLLMQQKIPIRSTLLYAIHPLILKESMASAHPDILVGGLLLMALISWRNCHAIFVGIFLALAVGTKISALIVLPFLLAMPRGQGWNWCGRVGLSFLFVLCLCYLPFWVQGGSDFKALSVFTQEWRFNPLVFRCVELLIHSGTKFVIAILSLSALGLLFVRWRLFYSDALPPLDYALLILLFFSPVVNPWYGLWLIAPALLLGRYWLAASVSVLMLAYFNSTVLLDSKLFAANDLVPAQFLVAWPFTLVQILLLLTVIAIEFISRNSHKTIGKV